MLDRVAQGELPDKHHLAFRDHTGALRHEHCLTRHGFDAAYTILYHQQRPHALSYLASEPTTDAQFVELGALRRRHFCPQRLAARGAYAGDAVALLGNDTLTLSVVQPRTSEPTYRVNADADELYFVRQGKGALRSVFGDLAFSPNDYVCIPKGVLHRFVLDAGPHDQLLIECQDLGIPKQWRNEVGQLRMDAPYCHRDFRRPQFIGPRDEQIRDVRIKRNGQQHRFVAAHSPLDVVGWDGTVYPWAFPILAFQPRVSSVHLPPIWHGTFTAKDTLICSFVPRPLDFHDNAVPCPYPHSSVDVDEVLYYVSGEFGSRSGIEVSSLTLHPRGIPHGPHPGRYETSVGQTHTNELAVMLDCYQPLRVTTAARTIEDPDYDQSFTR